MLVVVVNVSCSFPQYRSQVISLSISKVVGQWDQDSIGEYGTGTIGDTSLSSLSCLVSSLSDGLGLSVLPRAPVCASDERVLTFFQFGLDGLPFLLA
jgi:hypothetical protein